MVGGREGSRGWKNDKREPQEGTKGGGTGRKKWAEEGVTGEERVERKREGREKQEDGRKEA